MKRNFAIPAVVALIVAGACFVTFKPWQDIAHFYSMMSLSLSALVIATVTLEFYRGGRVLQGKLNTNLFGAMYWLTRRNTRRYGGYIVHFGVVVIFIGLAGAAFNQEKEQEMGLGDKLKVGHYELVGQKYSDDDTPNYQTQSAILDVYRDGQFVRTLYPEWREYKASQQPDHVVAIRSTPLEDLYVVYEGRNPDTDRPIIKAFVNPLVSWLWIGVLITALGTGIALVPNAAQIKSPVTVPAMVPSDSRSAALGGLGATR
jgi:cytochrome c-type biogenesis protein CcmF